MSSGLQTSCVKAKNTMTKEEYPNIIYKYRNWTDKHNKNVFLKNQLFLSSPKTFNDPFDCRIPENFYLLDTQEKIENYVTLFRNRRSEFVVNEEILNQEIEITRYRLTNYLEKYHNINEKILFEKQDAHFGILSMSINWNSILMWSHYANNHKGYCIGFWEEKFRNSYFLKGGQVIYNPKNEYPIIDPNNNNQIEVGFIQTHNKAYDWKYEEEYRFTKIFDEENPSNEERTLTYDDSYIAEIIIGLEMQEKDRKRIINLAKKRRIKVYEIEKKPFKFEITKKEIK